MALKVPVDMLKPFESVMVLLEVLMVLAYPTPGVLLMVKVEIFSAVSMVQFPRPLPSKTAWSFGPGVPARRPRRRR